MKRTNSLARLLLGVVPLALLLSMSVSQVQAQNRGGADRGPRADRSGWWMTQQLDLTESQQVQINEITAAHRSERFQRRQDVRDQISEILTPEQREQFLALQNQRPNFRGQGMRGAPGRRGGGPGMFYGSSFAAQTLDLTPEQQTQLDALRQEHFAARQEWLSANPNASWTDRMAWRQEMQEDMLEKAASFLTPEQLEQLKTVQSTRPRGRF